MGIVETNVQFLACEHWLFKADFNYGWFDKIKQQKMTGYDFYTSTAIDATSKVKGSVYDISGALGYQFNWDCFRLSVAPLVGWSYYHQHFKNTHYFNHLNDQAFDARNHYKFSWNGPWIGFAAAYQVCCEWQFYVDYSFHWSDFRARYHDFSLNTFNENARTCLAHGKSNSAYGNEVTVGTTYQFCENWFLGFKFNYKDFWANNAKTDNRKFDNTAHYRTKNIQWNSYFATVDIGYIF